MKSLGFSLAINVILAILLFAGWKTMEKKEAEIYRLTDNFNAIVADTTEKAVLFLLSKKELAQVSPGAAQRVEQIETKQRGKVKEIHVVKYLPSSVVHDTVFIENGLCCERQVWEFPHGCVTNVVTYDPLNLGITDSLFGSIEIDRYVLAERPRWIIVKPRYWFKNSWPTSVRIENNCGLQIKENTIFEIQ
jgi:hypothetical protein